MAKINEAEVIKALIQKLKLSPSSDKVPSEVADKIIAIVSADPMPQIESKAKTTSDTTTSTMFTTLLDRDTFVIGGMLTVAKDVVSDSVFSSLEIVPSGKVTTPIIRLAYQPLTAGQFSESVSFSKPIKLERGSTITVTNQLGTASIDAIGIVYLYEQGKF